jgi:hypothetical protein
MATCAAASQSCVGFSQSASQLCDGAQCCRFHSATSTYFEPGEGLHVLNSRGSSRARAFGVSAEEGGGAGSALADHFADSSSVAITGAAVAAALLFGTCLGYLCGSRRSGCFAPPLPPPPPPPEKPVSAPMHTYGAPMYNYGGAEAAQSIRSHTGSHSLTSTPI